MPYEELVEYLKECCIDNVPVSMTSVLNTIKQNDEICIDYLTVSNKGSTYAVTYTHTERIYLCPIYRIDIRKIDNSSNTSILFNHDKDIRKINKVLFVSLTESNTVGTYCEDVKEYCL